MQFKISIFFVFLMALSGAYPVEAQRDYWEASLEVLSPQVLVGEPVLFRIEIVNHSDTEIVMPVEFGLCARFCCLSVEGPESNCMAGDRCPAVMPLPIYLTKKAYGPGKPVVISSDSNYPRCPGVYTVQYECSVPETASQPEQNLKTFAWESNDEVWTGDFSSNEARFQVIQPEGVDKEAYEAFGDSVLWGSRNRGELLRRFPTSTYAAYAVWEHYAKGVSNTNVEKEVASIQRGPTNESGSGLCDWEGRLDLRTHNRFSGFKYLRCRDAWVSLALKHHPDIWFADEMRLKLALDRFMLGDKDACAAGLEALADHARPYVAEKARALLEAMQSKGMLPGGSDDAPNVPAKPEPCEPTDR